MLPQQQASSYGAASSADDSVAPVPVGAPGTVEARRAVVEEAVRLQDWLAERGLVSSFPAPLTRELTA